MKYLLIGDSHCYEIGAMKKDWECCAFHGITSNEFNSRYPGPFVADVIIVSLGGNDARFPNSNSDFNKELPLLRSRLSANKVIWFLTRNSDTVRELQKNIAKEYNDLIIDSRDFELSQDNVHLSNSGYLNVAGIITSMSTNDE